VSPIDSARATFTVAATAFLELVERVPAGSWDGPGLGEWSLRSLVGHAGRSLVTVSTYLGTRADAVAAGSPAEYLDLTARLAVGAARDAITQRGVAAGEALGDDPSAALQEWYAAALAALDGLGPEDDPVVETAAGGMRVSDYLPTRTFELTVHSLDVARATGVEHTPPEAALGQSLAIAAASALRRGLGPAVLLALTGREPLPAGCSVVP
jgi:uncharacterized protein (TIGR03083 family)